jgi:hypothetical protein
MCPQEAFFKESQRILKKTGQAGPYMEILPEYRGEITSPLQTSPLQLFANS